MIRNVKKGQYIVCSDDRQSHMTTLLPKKLLSITKGEIYRIIDKKTEKKTKKSRFGGSFESTIISFKIKSDKGRMVWIRPHRFEYSPEAEKNQSRYDKLAKMLK